MNILKTITGVFNGQDMDGDDGKEYAVPENYASKSKLITGDRLRLDITKTGALLYKQIGKVLRQSVVGRFDDEKGVRPLDGGGLTPFRTVGLPD